MLNKKVIQDFINATYPELTGLSYDRIYSTIDKAVKYAAKVQKEYESLTKQDFVNMFEHYNWTAPKTFDSNKSLFMVFGKWYFQNRVKIVHFDQQRVSDIHELKYEDIDQDDRYDREYFPNYDDFLDAIDEIFGDYINADEDKDKYVMHRAYFLLMWENITRNELREIRIEDVEFFDDDQIKVNIRNPSFPRMVTIQNRRAADIVHKAITTTGYSRRTRYGDYNAVNFADTQMLLRNTYAKPVERYEPISVSTLNRYSNHQAQLSKDLPQNSRFHNKILVYRGISNSGSFCRLLEYERAYVPLRDLKPDAALKKIQEISRKASIIDYSLPSFLKNYEGWKNYFGHTIEND